MDPAELALVLKALTCGLSNCVEWIDDKTALRVRNDPDNQGLTPEEIKKMVRGFVTTHPQTVEQRPETREGWQDQRSYWYRVIIPITGFRHGLFVEIVLSDEDPDCPCIHLVNAHPERR